MEHTTFDALPAASRIWVYAAGRDLTDTDVSALERALEKSYHAWDMKAPGARGCHAFRDRRFLIVGADESAMQLTGCSVDAMMSWMMRLEEEIGLKLIDRMAVFYRGTDGGIRQVARFAVPGLLESGELTPETPVFDTIVSRVESLRENRFELPLRDSWLGELFVA